MTEKPPKPTLEETLRKIRGIWGELELTMKEHAAKGDKFAGEIVVAMDRYQRDGETQ